jgi:apolipoprotein N-acyltransferase
VIVEKLLNHLNSNGRYLLAFICGATSSFAFAPQSLIILLFLFSGLLVLLDACKNSAESFFLGWFFGLGHFIIGLYWFYYPLVIDKEQFGWLVPFAIIGIPSIIAIYIGLITLITHSLKVRNISKIIVFNGLWVIFEYLRAHLFTGFPWNLLGYSLSVSQEISQLAAFTGVYSLSWLALLIGAIPYIIFKRSNYAKIYCLIVILLTTIIYYYGNKRLQHINPSTEIMLRIVQANIKQTLSFDGSVEIANIHKQIRMSNLPSEIPIKYVIWPEGAFAFDIDYPGLIDLIKQAAPIGGALLTGGDRVDKTVNSYNWWNSLQIINHQGKKIAVYDKVHLVPFGEYIPLRWLLPVKKIVAGLDDCSFGKNPEYLTIDNKLPRFRSLICYEAIFPNEVIINNERPKWLLNITNDGWYGTSNGPYQHFVMSRFRSIEFGVPLVRAAKTGISAIIDSYGRVVKSLPLATEGVLDDYLPESIPTTTYFKYGDKPIFIIIFLSILFCFIFNSTKKLKVNLLAF